MQANARQITLFDREGKQLTHCRSQGSVSSSRSFLRMPNGWPSLKSISRRRVMISGSSILRAANRPESPSVASVKPRPRPAWSPDGSHVAYVGLRQGAYGLYQKLSNGEGTEELLYKSNAPVVLTDWSMDGRYLTYYATDLGGGAIFALPLAGSGERKPIEIFRSKFQLTGPRLSPDDRFRGLRIEPKPGRTELYVRPFRSSGCRRHGAFCRAMEAFRAGRSRHGVLAARRQGDQLPRSRSKHRLGFADHCAGF